MTNITKKYSNFILKFNFTTMEIPTTTPQYFIRNNIDITTIKIIIYSSEEVDFPASVISPFLCLPLKHLILRNVTTRLFTKLMSGTNLQSLTSLISLKLIAIWYKVKDDYYNSTPFPSLFTWFPNLQSLTLSGQTDSIFSILSSTRRSLQMKQVDIECTSNFKRSPPNFFETLDDFVSHLFPNAKFKVEKYKWYFIPGAQTRLNPHLNGSCGCEK